MTSASHPAAAPAARAVDLRKTYGSGDSAVHALAGVTLDLEAGRFTAIIRATTLALCETPASSRPVPGPQITAGSRARRHAVTVGVTAAAPQPNGAHCGRTGFGVADE